MSERATVDVLVVGGGPGGYTAALGCAGHGLRTTLVDRDGLGGTCLNVGCIPSKALIHAADRFAAASDASLAELGIAAGASIDLGRTVHWKDGVVGTLRGGVSSLLAAAGVTCLHGTATIVDGKTVEVATADGTIAVRAANLVIATGSHPLALPGLPFGGPVISSTEALSLTEVPRRLVVVGAGYIGLELGTAYAKLGASVTVVEATDRILPQYDPVLTRPVLRRLEQLGVEVLLGTRALARTDDGAGLVVQPAGGEVRHLDADAILVAVGRVPATSGFGLERLDLAMDGPFVRVDGTCQTSMRQVYAIGDVTGEPMLAHRATAQAALVADVLAGRHVAWDVRAMPAICFTDPEIVTVGLTPAAADDEGREVIVGTFPLVANGRALTLQRGDGLVQVVADAGDHVVVGVHAVGAGVSELAASGAQAVEMGATLEDLALTVFPHPSLSEAVHEAARRALDRDRRAVSG